jgi:hypothetical protein
MKQILIQILSALAGSENKIKVKKPNINFKEGFRRIVLVSILIWLFFDILDVFNSPQRDMGEIFIDALGALVCYFLYLLCIKILSWVFAGFKCNSQLESQEKSSFDIMKEMHKADLEN